MRVKNFYSATSAEPGDIFLVTVKAVVQDDGTYRLYRCPADVDYVPEGDRLFEGKMYTTIAHDDTGKVCMGIEITAQQLFPVLRATKGPDLS